MEAGISIFSKAEGTRAPRVLLAISAVGALLALGMNSSHIQADAALQLRELEDDELGRLDRGDADLAGDLPQVDGLGRVAPQRGAGVEVGRAMPAEDQPVGFETGNNDVRGRCGGTHGVCC